MVRRTNHGLEASIAIFNHRTPLPRKDLIRAYISVYSFWDCFV
jgi:hypothetical protein